MLAARPNGLPGGDAQPSTPLRPTGELKGLGRVSGTAVSFTDLLLGFVLAASNTVAGGQHVGGMASHWAAGLASCMQL